jgi:large subunit ribosomal protein L32e
MPKFIRRNWTKASRLGKGRKTKQVWRRAKGRHNKVREKRKGYPIKVMIGFKRDKKERNLIKKHAPILVNNMKELEKIKKGEIAIIGKIGNKKKIEMIKMAKEKGIPVYNVNVNKMLKKIKKKADKKETKEKAK